MTYCLLAESYCFVDYRLVAGAILLAAIEVKIVIAARYPVEVHIGDAKVHGIQIIRIGRQPLLQFLLYEFAPLRPRAQTLCYYVVGEALKFTIREFHLVVLRVEDD